MTAGRWISPAYSGDLIKNAQAGLDSRPLRSESLILCLGKVVLCLKDVETKALETSALGWWITQSCCPHVEVASDQKGPQSPIWNPRCSTFSVQGEGPLRSSNPPPPASVLPRSWVEGLPQGCFPLVLDAFWRSPRALGLEGGVSQAEDGSLLLSPVPWYKLIQAWSDSQE